MMGDFNCISCESRCSIGFCTSCATNAINTLNQRVEELEKEKRQGQGWGPAMVTLTENEKLKIALKEIKTKQPEILHITSIKQLREGFKNQALTIKQLLTLYVERGQQMERIGEERAALRKRLAALIAAGDKYHHQHPDHCICDACVAWIKAKGEKGGE